MTHNTKPVNIVPTQFSQLFDTSHQHNYGHVICILFTTLCTTTTSLLSSTRHRALHHEVWPPSARQLQLSSEKLLIKTHEQCHDLIVLSYDSVQECNNVSITAILANNIRLHQMHESVSQSVSHMVPQCGHYYITLAMC